MISLKYENTTFRCRHCQESGHLMGACPKRAQIQEADPKFQEYSSKATLTKLEETKGSFKIK
jgi:hypothetical protein